MSLPNARRLLEHPAPTYLIGVSEGDERAYIVSVHRDPTRAIPSITTAHELTPANLARLWEEVRTFWSARDMQRLSSAFADE